MIKEKLFLAVGCFLILSVICLSGCVTASAPLLPGQVDGDFTVSVDSLAARGADLRTKTYYIKSAMENVGDGDLQFQEFSRYIENALAQKGYTRKKDKGQADLLISLAYWMQDMTKYASSPLYKRVLVLVVSDLKDTVNHAQLWKITINSEGYVGDLRKVMPVMIVAGLPYFGEDSGGQKVVHVSGLDAMVLEIRK